MNKSWNEFIGLSLFYEGTWLGIDDQSFINETLWIIDETCK